MKQNKMTEPKSWGEFCNTGLFTFVNLILRPFGWALLTELDKETESTIISVHPARTVHRTVSESVQEQMHRRLAIYLKENANYLQDELDDRYSIDKT